jgi:hypothetical protein
MDLDSAILERLTSLGGSASPGVLRNDRRKKSALYDADPNKVDDALARLRDAGTIVFQNGKWWRRG